MRPLLPALLAATALAACGADEHEGLTPAPPETTRLTVEVTGARAEPITIEFGCGGSSCEPGQLEQLDEVARPADPQRACTQQYGGPEKAHVTGTLEGRRVDVTLTRSNGCGIADYEALFAALGREQPLGG